MTSHQRLVREVILQLKTGRLEPAWFQAKFGVDIRQEWHDTWQEYAAEGWLANEPDAITLTREGLLVVDGLLPAFFEAEHRSVRYT